MLNMIHNNLFRINGIHTLSHNFIADNNTKLPPLLMSF